MEQFSCPELYAVGAWCSGFVGVDCERHHEGEADGEVDDDPCEDCGEV